VTPILNLQLRPPETGFAFIPEDIRAFQEAGIKVNVTCHEYKLNNTRRHLQAIMHGYFEAADSVSFFNAKDLNNASRHANRSAFDDKTKFPLGGKDVEPFKHDPYDLRSKTLLTRVPPTVAYQRPTLEEFETRPPNMIAFGLIRENKGFEQALDIARNINEREWADGAKPRMIIAGAPSSPGLLARIIETKFDDISIARIRAENGGQELTQIISAQMEGRQIERFVQDLSKRGDLREKNPIDICLNVPQKEMPGLFSRAKYAVRIDNKGWANNASGSINAFANGCVVYTGWGMDTPDEVLPERSKIIRNTKTVESAVEGRYHGAIALPREKYDLKDRMQSKRKAKPDKQKHGWNANSILDDMHAREGDPSINKQTLRQVDRLFDEQFDPRIISTNLAEALGMDASDLEHSIAPHNSGKSIRSTVSQSAPNDMERWYDDVDIHNILQSYSRGEQDYLVGEPITRDPLQSIQRIGEAINRLENNQDVESIVIPVNVGRTSDGVYQGSHWTGLCITRGEDSQYRASYADSMAGAMDENLPSLRQILNNHGIRGDIREMVQDDNRQQNNGYDCGPWTAMNLDSLARNGQVPTLSPEVLEHIIDQRTFAAEERQAQDQMLLQPDLDIEPHREAQTSSYDIAHSMRTRLQGKATQPIKDQDYMRHTESSKAKIKERYDPSYDVAHSMRTRWKGKVTQPIKDQDYMRHTISSAAKRKDRDKDRDMSR
jgi:hypothetical protein